MSAADQTILLIHNDRAVCVKCANWRRSCDVLAARWGDAEARVGKLTVELADVLRRDDIVARGHESAAIAEAWQDKADALERLAESERQRAAQGRRIKQQRARIAELEAAVAALKGTKR